MFEPWRWPSRFPREVASAVSIVLLVLLAGATLGLVQQVGGAWATESPADALSRAQAAFKHEDYRLAAALFATLANKNNVTAQYWLAHMTELGLGMPRDPTKAIELYKQAARKGLNAADLRLGQIYLRGDLVPADFRQAKKYLECAAYSGDARAAALLADMYRRGLGTAPDLKEAYAWAEVAAVEGNATARRIRDQLLYSFNANDQSAALARADAIFSAIKLPQSQGLVAGSVQPMAPVGGQNSAGEPVS
jgi:TPR repeat protein